MAVSKRMQRLKKETTKQGQILPEFASANSQFPFQRGPTTVCSPRNE